MKIIKSITKLCCVFVIIPLCVREIYGVSLVWQKDDQATEVPFKFLKLCRDIMMINPLETFAQLDSEPTIPLTGVITNEPDWKLFHGRNLVLTEHIKGEMQIPVLIPTGLGPSVNLKQKRDLESKFGIEIVDIIESLQTSQETKDIVRNLMFQIPHVVQTVFTISQSIDHNKNLSDLHDILPTMPKCLKILDEDDELHSNILNSLRVIQQGIRNLCQQVKGSSDKLQQEFQYEETYCNILKEVKTLNQLYDRWKTRSTVLLKPYINGLLEMLNTYHPPAPEYSAAVGVMHITQNPIEAVTSVMSWAPGGMPPSSSNLGLSTSIFPETLPFSSEIVRNLGFLAHSETIYFYWRSFLPLASVAPYFFTQRDMCKICTAVAVEQIRYPFIALSSCSAHGRSKAKGKDSVDLSIKLFQNRWEPEFVSKQVSPNRNLLRIRVLGLG
jgi:hypothetical protein